MSPKKDTMPVCYSEASSKHKRNGSVSLDVTPNDPTSWNVTGNDRRQNYKKSHNNYSKRKNSFAIVIPTSMVEVRNIEGYFIRTVTKFGNSAKIDCPKEYVGRTVYVIVA
jgi:putative transposon-encoded protein